MQSPEDMTLRLAVTPGEPAGIGPDLVIQRVQQGCQHELVAFADPDLLTQRAALLKLPLRLRAPADQPAPLAPGELSVAPTPLSAPATPGKLAPENAGYVLETLESATSACLAGKAAALITGPVQKSVINDAGIAFSGHTEFLADRSGTPRVVMMLATGELRVALATTHLPLRSVADAISGQLLEQVIIILNRGLIDRFGLPHPRILVCGLNPHAGEGGHLGHEEQAIIEPVLAGLRQQGIQLQGPSPADTVFTPGHLAQCDVVLAMYHDQGLPVLKHLGFGAAVNITLGLPFIRTSVDHGTALDLAGSGRADTGSLTAAIDWATRMAKHSIGSAL